MESNYCDELQFKRKPGSIEKVRIVKSTEAEEFVRKLFDPDSIDVYESLVCVYLNSASETIGWMKISQGGFTGTYVDNKMIITGALVAGSVSIILAHNHPSGGLTPSNQDKTMTRNLNEICKLLKLNILDHIIITKESFYSMADNGDIY